MNPSAQLDKILSRVSSGNFEFARGDYFRKYLDKMSRMDNAVLKKSALANLRGVKSIGNSPLGLAIRKRQNTMVPEAVGEMSELSARLDSIIALDDRPRNTMGEFTSSEDRPATNPNNNAKVYKIGGNFSNAAVTGAGGAAGAGSVYGAGKLVKALYEKLRVKK